MRQKGLAVCPRPYADVSSWSQALEFSMNPLQDIFISYGRADSRDFAQYLCDRLLQHGYTVWYDFHDVPQGVDYRKQIDDAIEKVDNFLFIISPHATNLPYCWLEVERAIARDYSIEHCAVIHG